MIKKLLLISAMLLGGASLTANATPLLSFTPSSQSVNLGDSVSVAVVLSGLEDASGLNEILAAFDVTVSYNSLILSPSFLSVSFSPFGISPVFNASFPTGEVQWDLTSSASDTALQALQGSSVTLGTILFNTLSPGTSALSFSFHELVGLNNLLLDHSVANASITVNSVPEPTTMILMGLGALGMANAKRRKARLAV